MEASRLFQEHPQGFATEQKLYHQKKEKNKKSQISIYRKRKREILCDPNHKGTRPKLAAS